MRSEFFFFFVGSLVLWTGLPSVSTLFSDICSTVPKDSDKCGEAKNRFFYNTTSKLCEPFIYTGCPWNRNRFYTMEGCQRNCALVEKPGFCLQNPNIVTTECVAECVHDGNCPRDQKCCSFGCARRCSDPEDDICKLAAKPGPCDAKIRSWFYDWSAKRCKRFTYGGCHGNQNNFKKLKECQQKCVRRASS